jgi:hypothetical protein
MPEGDPAGYLPRVKRNRRAGKLKDVVPAKQLRGTFKGVVSKGLGEAGNRKVGAPNQSAKFKPTKSGNRPFKPRKRSA